MTDWRRKAEKAVEKVMQLAALRTSHEEKVEAVIPIISQAEPERKGLEECVEAILDKHKEDFPLMDVKCGNELRSSLLEILRKHLREAPVMSDEAVQSVIDLDISEEEFDKTLKMAQQAPEPSEDEEVCARELATAICNFVETVKGRPVPFVLTDFLPFIETHLRTLAPEPSEDSP